MWSAGEPFFHNNLRFSLRERVSCSCVVVLPSFLHTRLRTATLRRDADGQATLLNLLLRNYLQYNLYDQAEKLVSKSVFPELANNNEWARYLYYTGE